MSNYNEQSGGRRGDGGNRRDDYDPRRGGDDRRGGGQDRNDRQDGGRGEDRNDRYEDRQGGGRDGGRNDRYEDRQGGGRDGGRNDRYEDRQGGGRDGGRDDRYGDGHGRGQYDDRRGGNGDRRDGGNRNDGGHRNGEDRYDDRRRGSGDRGDGRNSQQSGGSGNGGGYNQGSSRGGYNQGSSRGGYNQGSSRGGYNQGSSRGGHSGGQENRPRRYNTDQLGNRMSEMNLRGPAGINRPQEVQKSNEPTQSDWTHKPDVVNVPKKELEYKNQTFASRPDKMVYDLKLGKKTRVIANYAPLQITKETIFCRYNVSFFAMMRGGRRRQITKREVTSVRFWELVAANPNYFTHRDRFIFNDVNILLVDENYRLPDAEFVHNMYDARGQITGKVEIVAAGTFKMESIVEDEDKKKYMVSLIDAIATTEARKFPQNSPFVVSKNSIFVANAEHRDAFPERITVNLPCGYQALTGLHMAVKMDCRAGPMVNFDVTHGVFTHTGYPILRLVLERIRNAMISDDQYADFLRHELPRLAMTRENCENLARLLRDRVLIYRMPGGPRTKKFKFTQFNMRGGNVMTAGEFQFNHEYPDGRNERMSMVQYYREIYQFEISPNLPIVVGTRSTAHRNTPCYPLETLYFHDTPDRLKGQIPMAILNTMVREISVTPEQRLRTIRELANQQPERLRTTPALVSSDHSIMREHGIEIGRELVEVNAVRLPAPTLVYGNATFTDKENDGVWDTETPERILKLLSKHSFVDQKAKALLPMVLWVPQHQGTPIPNFDLQQFDKLFQTVMQYGIEVWSVVENGIRKVQPLDTHNYKQKDTSDLESWVGRAKACAAQKQKEADENKQGLHIVPIILAIFEKRSTTMKNADYRLRSDYANIKQICDGEAGIHVQGILQDSFNRIDTRGPCSISHNIALKIFGKIGAIHFKLEQDGKHKTWAQLTNEKEPTLLLSIDVTHPSARAREIGTDLEKLSVASIVGNIDVAMSRFRETSRVQNPGQEQVVSMVLEIQERITEFATVSKVKPAHIVVYRDGIGETDFQRIMYEELSNINMAVKNMGFEKEPTITYIVVTKRHHTRFFGINKEDIYGEVGNLRPGTMIEDTITSNKYFDFFLQSHYGPLGTSRPAHYYVLHDTWAPSPSFWQTVTYALCYNYCRQSRTLSQPGPLMYAHLAAARAKDRLNAIATLWGERGRSRLNIESPTDMADLNDALRTHGNLEGMAFV